MQDSTGRENDQELGASGAESEATSKETLSDVEQNEVDTGPGSSSLDPGPSPDGAFDESKETGPI